MDQIKLVCFDLNKTLIKENSWIDLNLAMGMTPEEDQVLVDKFEAGIITYEEWQGLLDQIYKDKGKATRENIYRAVMKYTYLPGALEIVEYLKNKGYLLALLSGSLDFLVAHIANELGITLHAANNSFRFDENNYLSETITFGHDAKSKLRQLNNICKEQKIKITQCVCVGDGDNDIEIFRATKHGITFKGSKIESSAWKTIAQLSDITKIL